MSSFPPTWTAPYRWFLYHLESVSLSSVHRTPLQVQPSCCTETRVRPSQHRLVLTHTTRITRPNGSVEPFFPGECVPGFVGDPNRTDDLGVEKEIDTYRSVVSIHGPVGCSYTCLGLWAHHASTAPLRCTVTQLAVVLDYVDEGRGRRARARHRGRSGLKRDGSNKSLLYVVLARTMGCLGRKSKHQGAKRLGSRGNMEVLRMLFRPRNNITTRSKPTPHPP